MKPEHAKLYRDLYAAKGPAAFGLPPSEPASSDEAPSSSSSTSKSAKRMKKRREEERMCNDLMTCLTIREGEVFDPAVLQMKKPAASSSSSEKQS